MTYNVISWSGGKDSTALLLMMIEKGMQIDDIIFVDTGVEFPQMYEYVDIIIKKFNLKVTILKNELGYDGYFYSKRKKGKFVGTINGFPMTIACWANSRLKMKPLTAYFKEKNKIYGKENVVRYLAFAYDEIQRYEKQIKKNEYVVRCPLIEWKITEKECLDYLKSKNLINPLYEYFDRTGCWLCPKQKMGALRNLRKYFPELWNKLLEYDKVSPVPFKNNCTVKQLDDKFKKEEIE